MQKMTNEEAFEKWAIDYGLDYEPSFTRYDVEAAWFAAIAYMQEQSEPVAWKDVVGFEDNYEVSENGDIRNKKTQKIMSKNIMGSGYIKADLWKNGVRTQTSVHRIVAEAFLEKINGNEVNHINGIKSDNRVKNLEWTSRSNNVTHSYYELGHRIKPIMAINLDTGERREYSSVCNAVRDGFVSAHVHACLSGKLKHHKRHSFKYTTPQRQQPMKRLTDEQINKCFEKVMFDEEAEPTRERIANAIMDAMQELNK